MGLSFYFPATSSSDSLLSGVKGVKHSVITDPASKTPVSFNQFEEY